MGGSGCPGARLRAVADPPSLRAVQLHEERRQLRSGQSILRCNMLCPYILPTLYQFVKEIITDLISQR